VTLLALTAIVVAGGVCAGFVGALTGLGGAVVIVPLLTVGLGIDIRYAIGASLISVIATSSGAAAAYVKEGFTNLRVGMLLEIGTTIGAVLGAVLAGLVATSVIAVIFGVVLLYSAYLASRPHPEHALVAASDRWAVRMRLPSSYPTPQGPQAYGVQRVPTGFGIMVIAGVLSGLLGIGSGALKVLAMDRVMRLPFKVSTTTSNFMIGVTAAASAGVYLHRGYIDPGLAMALMLGVLTGALIGARVLTHAHPRRLRQFFVVVLVILALQMLYKGITGGL
jgi:uncharacterized membrane protein YfcA